MTTRLLIAPTDDMVRGERGVLSENVSAGSNVTITMPNNDGFAQNDFVVIGYEGKEEAELQQVNQAVSAGGTIRVATLLRAHKAGEPVVVYRFNKRKFYGCATENGTYAELSGSPATIQVDDLRGTFLEYAGTTYSYFKATYYNSSTTTETGDESPSLVVVENQTRYATLADIRGAAGIIGNPRISDGVVERARMYAEGVANAIVVGRYPLPLASVPSILSGAVEDIAAARILKRYMVDQEDDEWRNMQKEAMDTLKSIGSGDIILLDDDGLELAVSQREEGGGYPTGGSSDPDRVFPFDKKY